MAKRTDPDRRREPPDEEDATWLADEVETSSEEPGPSSSETNEWLAVGAGTVEVTLADERAAAEAADTEQGIGGPEEDLEREQEPEKTRRRFGWRRRQSDDQPEPVAEDPGKVEERTIAAAAAPAAPRAKTPPAAAPAGRPGRGSRPVPPRIAARVTELEQRLARLETAPPEESAQAAKPLAAPDDLDAIEGLRKAIVELETRVDAGLARLQRVESADAARLRRFDAEVRKISTAATTKLRQALEETSAAGAAQAAQAAPGGAEQGDLRPELEHLRRQMSADAERLGRLEAQINELAAAASEDRDRREARLDELAQELDRLRRDREADNELVAVLTERFRARPQAATGELLDLNQASFEQLRDLGISVTQATRVIAARDAVGGFSSLDELDALSGFPPAQLDSLKAAVRV